MGLGHSPSIVTSGMVLALDAGNTKSYPNTGTTWTDLSGNGNTGTLTNGPTFNSYDARTNINLYSEQFNNAVYSINQGTISTNQAASPDGTTTAESLTASAGTVNPYAYQAVTTVTSSVYTFSVYVKKNTHDFVQIVLNGVSNGFANFNISSGVVGTLGSGGSATSSIVNAGNGWYRCIITYTTATTSGNGYINLIGSATSGRNATFSAAGTESVYLWGQQLELGSFATSYIPTTSSPLTRSAGPATLVFDGLDDYATVSNNITPGTGDFAVSVFVYKTDTVTNRYVWDFGSNGGTLSGGTSITAGFRYYNPTVGYILGPTHTVNTWYNLVVSRISGITYFYSNGSLVNSAADTANIGFWGTTLNIGRYGGSLGYNHLGSISNLFIYKGRGLTTAEVLQNFNALRGRFGL